MRKESIWLRLRLGLVAMAALVALHVVSAAQVLAEILGEEAQLYSLEYGVDHAQASHRLKLQGAIGELDFQLSAHERPSYAGLWIEHTPAFKVVALFTDLVAPRRMRDRLESLPDLRDGVEVRQVRYSLAELEADQASARFISAQLGVPVNTDISVPNNRVEIYTTDPVGLEAELAATGLRLPQTVTIVEVDELARPLFHIYGGWSLNTCTTGFSVRAQNVYGILTAGHCSNNLSNSHAGNLQFMGEGCSSGRDVQWHTANLHFQPKVNDGPGGSWRWIKSTKSRASQAIGEYVCKFGMTTGLTCGTISSKSFDPNLACMYGPTYIRVQHSGVQMGMGGDSGGPVFSDFTAYGTVSCSIGPDLCYAPIDFISALGVEVVLYTEQPPPGGDPCFPNCWWEK